MDKNIADILDCIGQIESSLIKANSYLKDAKSMHRKIEEKQE